jgi:hypothetical protein
VETEIYFTSHVLIDLIALPEGHDKSNTKSIILERESSWHGFHPWRHLVYDDVSSKDEINILQGINDDARHHAGANLWGARATTVTGTTTFA